MTIRLVIADDHPIFREGLARSLADEPDISVIGQADDANTAIETACQMKPDIVLLDISMPGGGLAALRGVLKQTQPPIVAMLTVSEEDDDIVEALRSGARGYILKGVGARELGNIVRGLAAGSSYLSPSLGLKVLDALQNPGEAPAKNPIEALSRREQDILRLVAEGLSNKEVGQTLNLQEKTVKYHMTAILQKLPARNRVEAALIARDHWRGE